MKQRLAIIGAGEMASQAIHFANVDGRYLPIGVFVDYPEEMQSYEGLKRLGTIQDIEESYANGSFDCLFIAIGYKHLAFKQSLHASLKGKIPFATIIANATYIDPSSSIGEDVIIYPGTIIDKGVIVEDNVVLDLGALIGHNSVVGNASFIAGRTALAGFAKIGSCCFLGIGSTISDNISICNNVIIGASAVVIRDIVEEGAYVGIPAKKL